MAALSDNMAVALAQEPDAATGLAAIEERLASHWSAIREAAMVLAEFGAIDDDDISDVLMDTPDFASFRAGENLRLASFMISDCAAALEPGLRALQAVRLEGRETRVAARALFGELSRAHDSLIRLCGIRLTV